MQFMKSRKQFMGSWVYLNRKHMYLKDIFTSDGQNQNRFWIESIQITPFNIVDSDLIWFGCSKTFRCAWFVLVLFYKNKLLWFDLVTRKKSWRFDLIWYYLAFFLSESEFYQMILTIVIVDLYLYYNLYNR